jgi:ribosomal protein S2
MLPVFNIKKELKKLRQAISFMEEIKKNKKYPLGL